MRGIFNDTKIEMSVVKAGPKPEISILQVVLSEDRR